MKSTLVERVWGGRLFEEEGDEEVEEGEDDLDDLFGDDSDFDDEGAEPESPSEEEPPEEEEEEVEPLDPEAAVDALLTDDEYIFPELSDAASAAMKADAQGGEQVLSASLRHQVWGRSLFEAEDEAEVKAPPIDVVDYAKRVGDLMQNYTTLMDIPTLLFAQARKFLRDNYSEELVEQFEMVIDEMGITIDIGGDERGPSAQKQFSSEEDGMNPMTGPIGVGASGEGGRGGGGAI